MGQAGASTLSSLQADRDGEIGEGLGQLRGNGPDVVVRRLTLPIQSALLLLSDSAGCAESVGTDLWEFAVEIAGLRRLGLTITDCRWLVATGLAKHACETTSVQADRRVFDACRNLAFPKGTCFVITDRGRVCASALVKADAHNLPNDTLSASRSSLPTVGHSAVVSHAETTQLPTWDPDRQQLRVGRKIVKQFKVPAANQEAILAAFQEEGWAPRIDDPLAPKLNQDAKRRLHDTINSLNRNQKLPLIRFLGDGKGEGVRWEFVERHLDGDGKSAESE